MIDAKYFKDYKHNYLILKCENAGTEENYQVRMLASDKIDRILKCSVRNVNGATYFYYDISSKATLGNLYQRKKMSYEQVRDFLGQMAMIYQSLGQFFMEENGLLLQPDYIYYDFTSGKYMGLYYPDKNRQNGDAGSVNVYEELMDFLLNHIDTENQKLVDIVYRIYEMSEEQFFSLTDALLLFEDAQGETFAAQPVLESRDAKCFPEKGVFEEEDIFTVENFEDREMQAEEARTGKIQEGKKKNSIYYIIFAVCSLSGMGGAFWIYFNYELTQQELMMAICCAAVMGLCFLFALVQIVLSGRRNKIKEQEEQELLCNIEDEFRDVRPVSLQGVLDKNMNVAVGRNDYTRQKMESKKQQMPYQEEGRYGETVFIDSRKPDREYKLYALDKKNKRHIELTQFPFTIGKMAGCVDCVLMDDSISRLHARIERQDEKVFLTDMNSTNGTYKNGLRMEPSETVEIEPGDEIRFGKLNYCYR